MVHKLEILDTQWTLRLWSDPALQATEPVLLRFLGQMMAWKSTVPVKSVELKYNTSLAEYRLEFETLDDRDFQTRISTALAPIGVRPITDDFWTQAELAAYIPMVMLVGILIVHHGLDRFELVWL